MESDELLEEAAKRIPITVGTTKQLIRDMRQEIEVLEALIKAYQSVMVKVVPGPDGMGLEVPPTPQDIAGWIEGLQNEAWEWEKRYRDLLVERRAR